ncbi:MAG: prolipoprotein diacylglyceryl transferase [bacterium]|nr:prolipoprotein diacylglyceryl transferase [bacterium]MDT8394838.1 prolipoprotein diacylglyceryl transferase [bacterium]
MLPNLTLPTITIIGPLKIHPFGAFVAVAILLGYQLALRRAKRTALDTQTLADAGLWAVGIGFVISHLFWAILYNHDLVRENPLLLVMVWKGISSYGGFFGGTFGGWLYLKRKGIPPLPYLEAMLFGFVPAWVVARMGCTTAFDHPGRRTGFFLGMADGAGVVRHNLGFYEVLWTAVIAITLYTLRNYRPFRAFHIALVFLLYAPVRFFFDSLRVDDRLYLGFTPGQYFSVVVTGLGIWLIIKGLRNRRVQGAVKR